VTNIAEIASGDRRVAALYALGLLDPQKESRFDRVLGMAAEFFALPRAAIALAGRSELIIKARHGFTESAPRLAGSLTEAVMRTDGIFLVEDARTDPRFANHPMVTGPPFIGLYVGVALHAPGGEVIGALGMSSPEPRHFGRTARENFGRVATWIEEELASETDQKRAAAVQKALTPRTVAMDGYELAGRATPSKAVGGDFFDWYTVPGGLAVTVADVMGKGVGAALIAATVRAVLRSAPPNAAVDATVATAARILDEDLRGTDSFATLFHATVNQADGRMQYIDGGHGLTLVVHPDGTFDRLAHNDMPLGADLGQEWTRHEFVLGEGDTLITFSDGVLDLFDGSFGSFDSVAAIVTESASAADVVRTLTQLAERDSSTDDVVVVVLRRLAR
jgi:hypothetical protein